MTAALISVFVLLAAAVACVVYREPHGRHHCPARVRVRVHPEKRAHR